MKDSWLSIALFAGVLVLYEFVPTLRQEIALRGDSASDAMGVVEHQRQISHSDSADRFEVDYRFNAVEGPVQRHYECQCPELAKYRAGSAIVVRYARLRPEVNRPAAVRYNFTWLLFGTLLGAALVVGALLGLLLKKRGVAATPVPASRSPKAVRSQPSSTVAEFQARRECANFMQPCPKCGYERKPTDTAPDWQCPACGIAYAKYKPSDKATRNLSETPNGETDETIKEYQRRRRELQPRWNKTMAIAFPGFALFALGVQFEISPLTIIGIVIFLVGFGRGAYLWHHYKRCPVCGTLQLGGWTFPYLTCAGCGARLSSGAKDSS